MVRNIDLCGMDCSLTTAQPKGYVAQGLVPCFWAAGRKAPRYDNCNRGQKHRVIRLNNYAHRCRGRLNSLREHEDYRMKTNCSASRQFNLTPSPFPTREGAFSHSNRQKSARQYASHVRGRENQRKPIEDHLSPWAHRYTQIFRYPFAMAKDESNTDGGSFPLRLSPPLSPSPASGRGGL